MDLHPYQMIRPDSIMRTGVVQPFSVRSMDPVQYARAEINPFIDAVRPAGVQLEGLGVPTATRAPLLGEGTLEAKTKLYIGVGGFTGGLIVGALAAWLLLK